MGHRLSWSLKVGPIAHCWLVYRSKVLDQLGPLRRSRTQNVIIGEMKLVLPRAERVPRLQSLGILFDHVSISYGVLA